MSPHGYVDEDGRPVLVVTLPAGDDDEAVHRGWLAWCADPDPEGPPLGVLMRAAIANGVHVQAIAEATGRDITEIEGLIR